MLQSVDKAVVPPRLLNKHTIQPHPKCRRKNKSPMSLPPHLLPDLAKIRWRVTQLSVTDNDVTLFYSKCDQNYVHTIRMSQSERRASFFFGSTHHHHHHHHHTILTFHHDKNRPRFPPRSCRRCLCRCRHQDCRGAARPPQTRGTVTRVTRGWYHHPPLRGSVGGLAPHDSTRRCTGTLAGQCFDHSH